RRLRPAGQVLCRGRDRYRPFHQREGPGDPGHPGHPHDHHLQGLRLTPYCHSFARSPGDAVRMGYPGIHTIRGMMGVAPLLWDKDGAIRPDTGLVGEPMLIRRRVARLGLTSDSIKAILLTHGHLDHAGNLAWARRWCGAPIHAHASE